jgi:ABC-type Na+ efflux pump permease subunit
MNPGFVWRSARKDITRRLRDPWALIFWIGMPALIAALIVLAFGGDDTAPVAHVRLVDHDSTFASGLVMRALEQSPTIEAQAIADSVAGRDLIEREGLTALIVVPKGFQQAVLDDRPVHLAVITNPAQRILPGMVTETLAMLADASFYVQRLFGPELRTFAAGPPPGASAFGDPQVAALSTGLNRKIGRLSQAVFPPQITIEAKVDSTQQSGPKVGLGALFFPGILFMALLFMASGLASDVWIEKEGGTLRRVVSTPQHVRDFLAGKVLAGTILMTAVSAIAGVIGVVAFDVPWSAVPLAVLWAGFSGAVFLLLIMLLHLYATSARTAGVFTTMMIFPLLMIGGSFFPFEAMPAGLARIGRMTPNGWAVTQLKAMLWGGIDPGALAGAFAALLAVGLVAFLISAARMARGFVRG